MHLYNCRPFDPRFGSKAKDGLYCNNTEENHMLKSQCGIVAALAFLCCGSQSDAADGSSSKLMADLPKSQGPEWVLYEDIPEDGEIVSFDNAGDTEGAFEICQSEAGIVGTLEESPYGAVCDTKDGAEESFYVLRVPDQEDQEDEEQESAGFVITRPVEDEESVGTGMMPDFDWSEQEQIEIQEALEATDAWQRYLDEGPEAGGNKRRSGEVSQKEEHF